MSQVLNSTTLTQRSIQCNFEITWIPSSLSSPRVIKKCYESLQLLTSEIFEEPIGTIECLGQTLAVWQCEWRGLKDDFYEHFIRSHNNIEVFQQLQVSSVPFLSDQLLSAMTLVRAFDSNFIFYYHSCPAKKMIYFLIFRLDIDVDDRAKPETLIYELMVKSPTEENHCKVINYTERRWFIDFFFFFFLFLSSRKPQTRPFLKLKFVEKCYQLEDDIFRIRDEELCAAITFQSIQKHLYQGHIHFSFLIKKSCSDTSTSTDGKKKCCDPKKVGQVTKVDSKPFSFANKGLMRGNNARKGQSIPSASASSSPAPANATANSANTQSATTSSATAEPATKSQPPDYSSINRVGEDKTPAFGNPFHRSCSTDEVSWKSLLFNFLACS